ncbi:hypothetical protein [Azospirillum sp. TSH58]|uniref:hypothetical protein n=1 Tax=Azospirillum sp. TSH58 TaxID=664962 RepID=UPI0018EE9B2D|nr:hypothetical protein [Azospirillum sp. TSH58]
MLYDRVEQTTIAVGTSALSLIAPTDASRRSFVQAAGSGAPVFYCIETTDGLSYEYGIGTCTAGSPDTLTRTTVLLSSNGGALVNFPAGTKRVFSCLPASRAVVARAYVAFGSAGTILSSNGVSSVTRSGTGDYTVTFAGAFLNANFTTTAASSSTGGGEHALLQLGARTATTAQILFVRRDTGASVDPLFVCAAFFGV